MRGIEVIIFLLFAGASWASPIGSVEEDDVFVMPEVEGEIVAEVQRRWEMIPDDSGKMHLVDMHAPEVEPEPHFNALQDVFYVLFTRRNRLAGQRLARTTASINNSQWNSSQGFRFIIHGWLGSHTGSLNTPLTTALLNRADHNVVRVDWSAGNSAVYATSRNRVSAIGTTVGGFIDWLHQNNFLTFSRVHIIGFSLGAHIAGHAGKAVNRGRIQAIFGMDPAGPLFSVNSPSARLASGDAVYTEMIASNADGLGIADPIARASFYPNWGQSQPGCLTSTCHHDRAWEFYVESVNSDRFVARRCGLTININRETCTNGGSGVMGTDSSTKTLTGTFFLETNRSSPFARG